MHHAFLVPARCQLLKELFSQVALSGIEALATTDRNSLAGIVRAYEAARVTKVRLIIACRLPAE